MSTRKASVCGRLGQNEPYGPVDVCNLPQGHEGSHRGAHRGMVWDDDPKRRDRAHIKSGRTITGNIPDSGGNIRGN